MEEHGAYKKLIASSLLFAALVCIAYLPVLRSIGTHINGSPDDAYAIIWQLWWYKFSLWDILANPSFSSYVEAPFGVGITHTTAANHILALPLTYLFGPVTSYNFMILLSFFFSAIGMYLLTFEVTRCMAASFAAGLIYSFSPYHTVFSASGGMDASQIQYIPFTLFFLIRYDRLKRHGDLMLFLLFLLLTFLSFGYYAALVTLAAALYLAFTRVLPALFPALEGSGGNTVKAVAWAALGYIIFIAALNSYDTASSGVKALAAVAFPVFAYSAFKTRISLIKNIFQRFSELEPGKRALLAAGLSLLIAFTAVLLLPVFSVSSRSISASYLVPFFSYLVPSPDHPLLGGLVPGFFVPSPDPLSGKMVYMGLTVAALTLAGALRAVKDGGSTQRYFLFLLFFALLLSLPPMMRLGDLSIYGPVYFLHKLIPPFVDVRRVVLLLLVPASVLTGIWMAGLRGWTSRPLRIVIYAVITALICIEYYPDISVKDLSKTPSAYGWLAKKPGGFSVIEYPLTSIYDAKRYEAFYGQTIHEKRLVNPFGAQGHEPYPSEPSLRALIGRGGPASEPMANTRNAASALADLDVRYIVIRKDKMGAGARLQNEGVTLAADFEDSSVYEITERPKGSYLSFTDFQKDGYFKNYLENAGGDFIVKNPYVTSPVSTDKGRRWMFMSKGAGVKVAGKKDVLYDVGFTVKSVDVDALIKITDGAGLATVITAGKKPKDFTIKGLKAGTELRFELENIDALATVKGFLGDGAMGTQIAAGFSSMVVTESGESFKKDRFDLLRMYDGLLMKGI